MPMARYDNLHSRLVAMFKVALPLVALAILSTLFLISRTIDPEGAIPFSEVDIEDRVREPRMTAPDWAGMTEDGAAVSITASEARPGQGEGASPSATALTAVFDMPDGERANLRADRGALDQDGKALTVEGGVVITTGSGYRITSDAMTAQLDRTRLESPGPVAATGPLGEIDAGGMLMTQDAEKPGGYVLVFKSGVRLIYTPQN